MKSHQIIDHIAFAQECTSNDLLGHGRTQYIADGRAVAQHVLRTQGWTWQRIADLFNCHHSSIIHNCNKVERLPELKSMSDKIKSCQTK